MKTELNIKLSSRDCEKIQEDLEKVFPTMSGLHEETYLLYNKIKGMNCAYAVIENNEED